MESRQEAVAEAAKRRRAFDQGEHEYEGYNAAVDGYRHDSLILANAYLELFPPDDDEPLTEDWLKSVCHNWSENEINGSQFGWADFVIIDDEYHKIWLSISWNGSRDEVTDLFILEKCSGKSQGIGLVNSWVKTRGDVRRLCQALGINMGESPSSEQLSEWVKRSASPADLADSDDDWNENTKEDK